MLWFVFFLNLKVKANSDHPVMESLDTCGDVANEVANKLRNSIGDVCVNGPKNMEELIAVEVKIIEILENYNKSIPITYIGCDNDHFYGIVDCWDPDYGALDCVDVLKKNRWKVNIREDFVMGTKNFYEGGIIQKEDGKWELFHLESTGAFYPTERPWYDKSNGWGAPYKFQQGEGKCHSGYGSTYTEKVESGVLGIDKMGVCAKGSSDMMIFSWRGWDECRADDPCLDGEGDCGDDGDCLGDLVCWNRETGTTEVPWYTGEPMYDFTSFTAIELTDNVLNLGSADFCVRRLQEPTKEGLSTEKLILVATGGILASILLLWTLQNLGIFSFFADRMMTKIAVVVAKFTKEQLDIMSAIFLFVEVNTNNSNVSTNFLIAFLFFISVDCFCWLISMYYLIPTLYHSCIDDGETRDLSNMSLSEISYAKDDITTEDIRRTMEMVQDDVNIAWCGCLHFGFGDIAGVIISLSSLYWYPELISKLYLFSTGIQCLKCGFNCTYLRELHVGYKRLENLKNNLDEKLSERDD